MKQTVTGRTSKMSENAQYILETVADYIGPLKDKVEQIEQLKSAALAISEKVSSLDEKNSLDLSKNKEIETALNLLSSKVELIDDKAAVNLETEKSDIVLLNSKLDDISGQVDMLMSSLETLSQNFSLLLTATTNMAAKVDADASPETPYTDSFLEDLE